MTKTRNQNQFETTLFFFMCLRIKEIGDTEKETKRSKSLHQEKI